MTIDSTAPREGSFDLPTTLYWELPQLDRDELAGLVATVSSEAHLRIGARLSARCTDLQLDEFSTLIDSQDDAACARWLEENIPGHSAIAADEMEALVAETVVAVGGQRRRRGIERLSHGLLLRALEHQKLQYRDRDDFVEVPLERDGAPAVMIRLMTADGRLFCARASYPVPSAERRRTEILAFVREFNARTYFPKVYTVDNDDDGSSDVVAEFAVPLGAGLHGELLDHLVTVAIGGMRRLLEDLDVASGQWHPQLF